MTATTTNQRQETLESARYAYYGVQSAGIEKALNEFVDNYVDHELSDDWDIIITETGMPVMQVPTDSGTRYLTPFRGYRYQMSGTVNGSGDYGASEVCTDMFKLARMDELGYKCLDAFATIAIHKAGGRVGIKNYMNYCIFMSLSVAYLRTHEDHIKKCYGIA